MVVEMAVILTGDGIWAWLDQHPEAVRRAKLKAILRAAQKQCFEEFAAGTLPRSQGLDSRFRESYVSKVSARAPGYLKRVMQFYRGRYLPFTSPTANGNEAKKGGFLGHMRDNIRQPGAGYRVSAKNGTDVVTTSMTLPAARILNFHPKYRAEFLDLQGRNRWDGLMIERRLMAIAEPKILAEIQRAQRRILKGSHGK